MHVASYAIRSCYYYALGHASKFIHPGATRIDSTDQGNTGVEHVAVQNQDGSVVLIVLNPRVEQSNSPDDKTFKERQLTVRWNNEAFAYTLPKGAVAATFVWPAPPRDPSELPTDLPGAQLIEIPRIPVLEPGKTAQIEFVIQNTSQADWYAKDLTTLINVNQQTLGASTPQQLLHAIPRGATAKWVLTITAPEQPGVYDSIWQMAFDGQPFGDRIPLSVVVVPKGSYAGLGTLINAMLEQERQRLGQAFEKAWNDLKAEIERQIQAEIQRQLYRATGGLCGTAPAGLVIAGGLAWWRRRRRAEDM